MKFTPSQKLVICIICSIEQMTFIGGSIWLVGWNGFGAWTFFWAGLLVVGCSPSTLIRALER